MTLKEHIEDISNQLKKGAFTAEAEVSLGIVQRLLLGPLGWKVTIPQVIIPEYTMEGQRVDFALCHPPGKPLVFIEVKKVGNLEGAEEQLFRYAFRRGVPIAILTDGRKWRFFYPIGIGDFRERKVHELDLIETDSKECTERLNRYLNYEAVQIGDAVKAIEEDYRNVSKQRQVERRLPEAWNKLLEDEDEDGFSEFLIEAIAGKTESLCGDRPTTEQVLNYLKSLKRQTESDRKEYTQSTFRDEKQGSSSTFETGSQKRSPTSLVVTMPNGEVIDHYIASTTYLEVINKLGCDKVMHVAPTIVSTDNFPDHQKEGVPSECGKYFIYAAIGNREKRKNLKKIARDLDIQLKVE